MKNNIRKAISIVIALCIAAAVIGLPAGRAKAEGDIEVKFYKGSNYYSEDADGNFTPVEYTSIDLASVKAGSELPELGAGFDSWEIRTPAQDMSLLYATNPDQKTWTQEMIDALMALTYEIDGNKFANFVGFSKKYGDHDPSCGWNAESEQEIADKTGHYSKYIMNFIYPGSGGADYGDYTTLDIDIRALRPGDKIPDRIEGKNAWRFWCADGTELLTSTDAVFSQTQIDTLKKAAAAGKTIVASGATAQESGSDEFIDVKEGMVNATSYKAIYWAVDNGIVKGYNDGSFKPETICTREQFSIMLWRFAGEPSADASAVNKFTDAADFSNGAKKAVAWAVEQGIVAGFSDGTFQPKEDITRAQVAVMLWRYAGKEDVSATSKFSDISSYSKNVQGAIIWLEGNKIASGYAGGIFKPDDGCQRQHMAIFLFRYNNK